MKKKKTKKKKVGKKVVEKKKKGEKPKKTEEKKIEGKKKESKKSEGKKKRKNVKKTMKKKKKTVTVVESSEEDENSDDSSSSEKEGPLRRKVPKNGMLTESKSRVRGIKNGFIAHRNDRDIMRAPLQELYHTYKSMVAFVRDSVHEANSSGFKPHGRDVSMLKLLTRLLDDVLLDS